MVGIRSTFAAVAVSATAMAALAPLARAAEAPDFSGIYWITEYKAKLQLVGGGDLPLTAKGKEEYEKNIAGLKDGSIVDVARRFCVPDGIPRVLANPYPFEIVNSPAAQ